MSDLRSRDARRVWHPYTRHGEDPPLAVVGARGARLELEDGSTLLDAISSWWTTLHGHGHPQLVEALRAQAERLDHVLFAGATHEPAVALAEALVAVAPPGLERVFYSDDGSTAVEVALKLAYHAWVNRGEEGRTVFVALEGSYHGDTFGAMAVGDPVPFFDAYRPLLFEVRRVPVDAAALAEALEELATRCAAVIIEPLVQGAGGMRMHSEDFVRDVRALCDRHGVPLIADEVMTGFGRTGSLFACGAAGVTPDLLCLAKGLTNGMLPLAATLVTDALWRSFTERGPERFFPHGHSMTANPIGCAVALASLELARRDEVPARLDAIGRRIEAGLRGIAARPGVRDLRRRGGIVALDLVPPGERPGGYLAAVGLELRRRALSRGVLLRPLGNVLYALPPACVSDAECDEIAATMRALAEGVT